LIEVNSNPYLGTPNEYMMELVPKMLDDMVKLVVDSKYEPKIVDESLQNGFEILYREDQACDMIEKEPVNMRRPFDIELCYPVNYDSKTIDESIAHSRRSDALKQSLLVTDTNIPEFTPVVESDMIEQKFD
jgi:hypothetical protein